MKSISKCAVLQNRYIHPGWTGTLPRAIAGAILLLLVLAPTAEAVTKKPARIVSMNLCLDQLLLDFVSPQRIAALSALSRSQEISPVAARAAQMPVNDGTAEGALRFDPDLVLVTPYTRRTTVQLLRRLGARVVEIPAAASLDGIRENILALGRAVEEEDRAARLVSEFDSRLAAVASTNVSRPVAAPYYASNFTSGTGTLVHDVLQAAGYENLAARLGRTGTATLSLEQLLWQQPDVVVFSHTRELYPTVTSRNLGHPALRSLLETTPSIAIAERSWLCGTPAILDVVEQLAEFRGRLQRVEH
ncbi:MAG: ABC transporter substrate-binding protein [Hyphomicrobiales bacterium]